MNCATTGRFEPGTHWRPQATHWNKSWLEHQYLTLGLSAGEIADAAGFGRTAIEYWLKKHDIPTRSSGQARAIKHWGASGPANPMFGRLGPASPAYVSGSSPERAKLFARTEGKEFRAAVLARDGFTCRRCDHKPETHGVALPVHHIKPWARHPELRYSIDNGVTLCKRCHLWVHSKKNVNREWLQ